MLGPLGPAREPNSYDLCEDHSDRLSAPRGWEVIRLPGVDGAAPVTPDDDLMALARAVRETGMLEDETPAEYPAPDPESVRVVASRGHLSVIVDSTGSGGARS